MTKNKIFTVCSSGEKLNYCDNQIESLFYLCSFILLFTIFSGGKTNLIIFIILIFIISNSQHPTFNLFSSNFISTKGIVNVVGLNEQKSTLHLPLFEHEFSLIYFHAHYINIQCLKLSSSLSSKWWIIIFQINTMIPWM